MAGGTPNFDDQERRAKTADDTVPMPMDKTDIRQADTRRMNWRVLTTSGVIIAVLAVVAFFVWLS